MLIVRNIPITNQYNALGTNVWRKDGIAKVTGAEKYTSDIALPRMWHARTLRSPHPHARIVSIDTSEAEAMGEKALRTTKIEYEILPLDVAYTVQVDTGQRQLLWPHHSLLLMQQIPMGDSSFCSCCAKNFASAVGFGGEQRG